MLDELHALVTSKRGDLLSLGLARLWKLAPEMRGHRPVGDGRRARIAWHVFWCRSPSGESVSADIVVAGGAAEPVVEMLDTKERSALGRALGAPCARRDLRSHQGQQDDAGLRQHPQSGRDAVPGSLAHE